jgi:hypothetical protein
MSAVMHGEDFSADDFACRLILEAAQVALEAQGWRVQKYKY